MKTTDSTYKFLRIFLGLFLILYALNQFLHFIPTGYGAMPDSSKAFIDSVAAYLPALYIFEIIVGVLILLNKWVPFLLIVLFPLSLAFLIFSISNQDLMENWPAFVVAILNFVLVHYNRKLYNPLFS
ncbi:hypothetical protein [Aegicerativicinus sediminis]|uniref:hypothetical protein n=1 Tax=Aegicerativicinus sediminis TaxID=2893202 RepID=UPI001E311225|nr:hypothetical protein [Aegicerativicinus sediminis]